MFRVLRRRENSDLNKALKLLDIVRNLAVLESLNVFQVYRHVGKMYRAAVDLASRATSLRPVD